MFGKIALAAATASLMLALAVPAHAANDRKLSGRYKTTLPATAGVPSGSIEFNRQKNGSYDYQVSLGHVDASGVKITVATDTNGNGRLDIDEALNQTQLNCDLTPNHKHKASCAGNFVGATPLASDLSIPFLSSYLHAASALLK